MSATLLRIAAVIALAAILPWLAHAAPSLEHAPEAEARFLERCVDEGMTPWACRAFMETLQQQLGYAGFLDYAAAGRPDAAPAAARLSASR
ncbi:hypothetical protein [Plastoroseomonas hellenica]|uniref:hypothetical protein n=1 Tax=Plastoroseomonas hellenica TaxID=2687306 RepID=UPI001BAB4D86|nr:hypothetical protein [Plastoroseomonas hellenica]MBR0646136.1 hypothetical protein [Plastoroseomonas hellenica]